MTHAREGTCLPASTRITAARVPCRRMHWVDDEYTVGIRGLARATRTSTVGIIGIVRVYICGYPAYLAIAIHT